MAERRMFAKTVINSDAFIELPIGARLLYFDLGMIADDDGFTNSVKKTMRINGTTQKDLNALIDSGFVISFTSGVIAIRDWLIHNSIQKDRYKETLFTDEKSLLMIEKNSPYTVCIQDGNSSETQDRLGKVNIAEGKDKLEKVNIAKVNLGKLSIDKVSEEKDTYISIEKSMTGLSDKNLEEEFEQLWFNYPKKKSKKDALRHYKNARKHGTTFDEVMNGLMAYVTYIQEEKIDPQYIKHGSTWFNQECWNDDYSLRRKKTLNDISYSELDAMIEKEREMSRNEQRLLP